MMRPVALLLAVSALVAGCVGTPGESPAATLPPGATKLLPEVTALVHKAGDAASGAPAVDVSAITFDIGHDAGEPTIAIATDGTMFYAASTFDNLCTPENPVRDLCVPRTDILRSTDKGRTWEDVTPYYPGGVVRAHPETGDPMVYIDPVTQRVFDIDQRGGVACYTVTYSDDLGDSWTGAFPACDAPPADHQTIVAAKPRVLPAGPLYPNFVFVCWNQVYATACVRSMDGGTTFQRVQPPYEGVAPGEDCIVGPVASALVGHLKASADGVLYLPKEHCGQPLIAVSADDGVSWQRALVSDMPALGNDPAVAVDTSGNVYYVFQSEETSHILLATSTDQGATWSAPVDVTPPGITAAHLPALAAGDDGRLALAWVGTDDPEGFEADLAEDETPNATWHGYISVITDALSPAPTVTTVRVNPADDPLVRGRCGPGRCPGLTDFIDVQIDADGRVWAPFVDACIDACASDPEAENNADAGFLAALRTGPGLRADVTTLAPFDAQG